MTLRDVAERLDTFSEDATIYAITRRREWTSDTPDLVRQSPEGGATVQVFDGVTFYYVLEVFLAQEVVEAYQEHHGTTNPSTAEKLAAILYYAEHDSYLPPPGGWR